MQIAILGGTGDIGEGLALRFGRDTAHHVVIGSRNEEKALDKASEYRERLNSSVNDAAISGADNVSAAEEGDIVIVAIPPQHLRDTVESVDDVLTDDTLLVSPAVGMKRDESGFHYHPPNNGSIAELIDSTVSGEIAVVGAFQNLAAGLLSNLENEITADVVVTGDDPDAKASVMTLAEEVSGLRALDGGSLSNSAEVESLTPLLINIAMNNDGMHDLGVRFQ